MEKEKTVVFPTSVYLTVDSKDRNQTSIQPWNRFTLQKPQALLDAFAKKLIVSEVRFPWYIPNITPLNNSFTLVIDLDPPELITIPSGFYTPGQLVIAINTAMTLLANAPVLSYDRPSNRYTFTMAVGFPSAFYFFNYTTTTTPPNEQVYSTTPSLLRTLGFNFDQVSGSGVNTAIQGQPTMSLYTNYVDIVSTRLTRFQKVRDGDSANNSQASTICRIYLADEASNPLLNYLIQTNTNPDGGIGTFPLLIHRQFKNAKAINWSPDNFVDYFDVSVLDEYNNVVPLIPQPYGSGTSGNFNAQYPDFQITFVCTE
jgi:hypothetical protein